MLNNITNTIQSASPYISGVCFASAAAVAGRQFGMASYYKMGGIIANRFGKDSTQWEQSSQEYWTAAKKNAFRDLTAITSLIILGVSASCAGKCVMPKNIPDNDRNKLDKTPDSPENFYENLNERFDHFYNNLHIYLPGYLSITLPLAYYLGGKHGNHNCLRQITIVEFAINSLFEKR